MLTELEAEVTLVDGLHFSGANHFGLGAHFDSKPMDEPGVGPTPMEMLLQAAGACTGMDVAAVLRKRRIEPAFLQIQLTGIKRDEHPRIFIKVHAIYRAKGPGLTLEELARAASLSQNTYCSIFGMLKHSAEVTWSCEIVE
ncbi:MAG: OsmC family protein [Calditrichaeota bacterium]|nr:OsmC family protein [Calditrichota bacterium]